jgi:hypothetical protein
LLIINYILFRKNAFLIASKVEMQMLLAPVILQSFTNVPLVEPKSTILKLSPLPLVSPFLDMLSIKVRYCSLHRGLFDQSNLLTAVRP